MRRKSPEEALRRFYEAAERATVAFQRLAMAWAAEEMRACPREMDNRLVDWLKD